MTMMLSRIWVICFFLTSFLSVLFSFNEVFAVLAFANNGVEVIADYHPNAASLFPDSSFPGELKASNSSIIKYTAFNILIL